MTPLPYIIEVQIAFALLWLVYRLAMHRGGRMAVNRAWLLGIPALALLIPALTIRVWPAPQWVAMPILEADGIEAVVLAEPLAEPFDWRWVYLAGVAVLLIVSAVQLFKLWRIIRSAQHVRIEGTDCLQTERIGRAATFIGHVLVNPGQLTGSELAQVVAHERAHVALGHSYDLLFAQGVCIALWWNPFVWLWKRSLREVHEYQADAAVLAGGTDASRYATLILKSLTDIRPGFVSGFSYQLLKNRLVMIKKRRRGAAARILFTLPVVAGLMVAFSCAAKKPVQAASGADPISVIAYSAPADPPRTTPVDHSRPRIEYRAASVQTDSTREIAIRIAGGDTVVSVDGQVVSNSFSSVAEVIDRVRENLRNDNALRVSMRIDKAPTDESPAVFTIKQRGDNASSTEGGPLYIIDGVEVPPSFIDAIAPEKIASISVLKDAATKEKYGERAKNGVVVITLKEKKEEAPIDTDEAFLVVENMPKFRGGDVNTFREWVGSMLDLRSGEGRVVVQFIVEKDGSVRHVTAIQNPDQVLTDGVMHIVRSSPKWTPGTQRGEAVRVKYSIPVVFSKEEPAPRDPDEPFLIVENMPKFQGGDINTFRQWVLGQLKYPAKATEANEQGRVILQFIIERDGSVSNVTALQGPKSLQEEALRVVKSSPKWTPGTQRGEAVRVRFHFPVEFSMQDSGK